MPKFVTAIERLANRQGQTPGCVEKHNCRPYMKHGRCVDCGGLTDQTTLRIEEGTLRRRRMPVCFQCSMGPNPRQEQLRKQRVDRDWQKVTDPIATETLRFDVMPEQYAGRTRATLRAFRAAEADTAVVSGVGVSTLNASIRNLGLADEMYAELRDDETVLRKVAR